MPADLFPFAAGAYGPFTAPAEEPGEGVRGYRNIYFVDGNKGSDGNSGLSLGSQNAFKTVQKALDTVQDEDTIIVTRGSGNYDEELTTGQVIDTSDMVAGRGRYVSLIGASPTRWPYDAPQLYNTSGSTASLFVRSPGWRVSGFRIVGDSGSPACLKTQMAQAGATAGTNWGAGLTVDNCVFYGAVGSTNGFQPKANVDVRLENCKFEQFKSDTLAAVADEGGGFSFAKIDILNCHFINNVACIDNGLQVSVIRGNIIGGNKEQTMTRGIDLRSGGGGNVISGNYLGGVYKTFGNSGVYEGIASDEWAGNYASDLTGASVDSATGITWKDPAA